tara:strand:+ start:428 stop:709 length:282 start_codon:yes stop_codon:yes gene_type:complete
MSEKNKGFTFPLEILSCPWSDLSSYCNEGTVFFVDSSIDLKELAKAVANDQTAFVEKVMNEKKMWKALENEQTKETVCSFVIVQPYIFVGISK